jgi:hypothetical protein
MGYSVVKYDSNKGWVKDRTQKDNSYADFDTALELMLRLKDENPTEQYDVSYTPSQRKRK